MSSQGILLQLLLAVVVLVSAANAATPPTAADLKNFGCAGRCGDVNIPYPFGENKKCHLNGEFLIMCNDSKPYFRTNIPVRNILLEEGELLAKSYVARDCYNGSGNLATGLMLGTFSLSNSKNMFTAIGCNTRAAIEVEGQNYSVQTGCSSICIYRSIDQIYDETCSGIGCCQTFIPKEAGNITIFLESSDNHINVSYFNPCSYAFAVEKGAFKFSKNYLDAFNETMVPIVIDWGIGNERCDEAKGNQTSYACGVNSECNDRENGPGYTCKCKEGFRGNPYLLDGCQDIDECADPSTNMCLHKNRCSNEPLGNYTCSCPKGYHGDGRSDTKEGCIANQILLIQIVVGFAIGITVVLLSSSWLYWIFKKRKLINLKEKFFRDNGGLMLQQKLSRDERSTQEAIKIFTSEELKQATNNYDESIIIGQGGNGTVYKGILAHNRTVAIKKSKMVDQGQIEQFINEVVVLSQINHRNVVKLLGCCLETQVPLLVYEFITKGTLSDHIHNQTKGSSIPWETRLQIAAETAGVLSYLHYEASVPIIHRDVKCTNILLDDNYTAKVSDFGASRLVPLDEMQLSTMVQGTLGYLDPEYLLTSQLTEKSDVYSFGVVLVELITGEKALSFDRPEEERCVATYFLSSLKNDRLAQVIDECLVVEGNFEQIKEVAKLAKGCLKVKGEERPTMKEVAMELEGLRMLGKHPWINDDFEETEHLLGVASVDTNGFGGSSTTTSAYNDSIRQHIELQVLDDGR